MQPAHFADQLVTRPEVKMVGIGQQDLRPDLFECRLGDALHRRGGAHRHECRGLDHSVRGGELSQAGAGWIGAENLKFEGHAGECIKLSAD